jgi:hypothetical protein
MEPTESVSAVSIKFSRHKSSPFLKLALWQKPIRDSGLLVTTPTNAGKEERKQLII